MTELTGHRMSSGRDGLTFSLEASVELLGLAEFCPPAGTLPCAEGVACWEAASAVATSSRLIGDSSSCRRLRGEEQREWKRGESAPSRSAGVQDSAVLLWEGG